MEINQGFEPAHRAAKLKDFKERILPMFEAIPFDMDSACLAGEIYAKLEERRQRIGVGDTGIAALALTHGLTLVSANEKHFQRIADLGYPLNLMNWRS